MTSSPPPEAQHFRGKTLTPESPVPVHIPEPQNIPVLQNQIDPIFNLVSTHMEKATSDGNDYTIHPALNDQQLSQLLKDTRENQVEAAGHNDIEHAPGNVPVQQEKNQYESFLMLENSNVGSASNAESHVPSSHNPSPSSDSNQPSYSLASTGNPSLTPSNRSDSAYTSQPGQGMLSATAARDFPGPNLSSENDVDEGVNYQALLDNLSPSTAHPLSTEKDNAGPEDVIPDRNAATAQTPSAPAAYPSGLPARPPPQETSSIHQTYNAEENLQSYHKSTTQSNNANPYNSQGGNQYPPNPIYPPPSGPAPNGMNPPPPASFQQAPLSAGPPQNNPQNPRSEGNGRNYGFTGGSYTDRSAELSETPEVERAYQEFLHEEARHTSQGQWEKFPQGSRLFIGNLFTERVNKRDLFNIFHRYGRLAQISMKSAYGFVQYVQAADCNRAMQMEQGLELKGRKINLEISKPQRNSRNAAGGGGGGDNSRGNHGRRSKSPDHKRGHGRGHGSRSGNNDGQSRGRDDYRPGRSPSPRGTRGHDSYRGGRDRSPDRYFGARRSRSRSPFGVSGMYRDRSPRGRDMDDEANLPFPRRPPGSAPDVQIVLAEEVDRTFVGYIQQAFRERNMRCESLQLPPRVSMTAVTRRQILEGVQAVVKIFRRSQVTGKIPLQVFNRSQGHNNVQFDEYEDLDAGVAAEIVTRAKATAMAPQPTRQQYPAPQNYGNPQYGQTPPTIPAQGNLPQPVPGGPPQSNVANLITSMDGPSLQRLLTSMTQNQQGPQSPMGQLQNPNQGPTPDLSVLLSSVNQQMKQPGGPHQPYQHQVPPSHGYPPYVNQPPGQYPPPSVPGPNPMMQNNPALSQFLNGPQNRQGQPGMHQPNQSYPQQQPQNVQDIMAQLARYK